MQAHTTLHQAASSADTSGNVHPLNPQFSPQPARTPVVSLALAAAGSPRASSVLLSAKLNPPTTTPAQVPRTQVCDLVCHAATVKLVLVRAPAGFGKTTAMMQCRARFEDTGVDTAWLTLDSADNDASRFLGCLSEAVARLGGAEVAGPAGKRRGLSDRLSPGEIALDVLEQLATHSSPFALFLDDFELIHEPAVLGLVRELIDHLPRRGQLVLGSRSLPDLGLGRLRARGQLLEVDADRLRFSLDDTVEFLNRRRQLPLPVEDLSRLHHKTEGWVAALWLASVALERREARSEFIERFSGSNQAVADYLAEDVLARQPAPIRRFLLRTSILRHLNPSLCRALDPEADNARMLEALDSANLFLTPIDGMEHTYRYHSLFADFLRTQLLREMPEEAPRLHRAAARWYMDNGRPVPAIDHAIDGGDFDQALDLLSRHAEVFLAQGRMRLLSRWFAALPAERLTAHPLLQLVAVWSVCFTRGPWAAMPMLEACGAASSSEPAVRAHVMALRPTLLAMMDRYEEADAAGRESLARLPTGHPFADSVLTNAMANVVSVVGEHSEAHQLLQAARRAQSKSASAFNQMYSESVEGMIDLQEGRLRQATARFRMAVNATHAGSYSHTNGNAWAGVLYAAVVYEADQLEQAEHLLNVYVPLATDVGLPDHMIAGYVMLSRIAFHRGDIDHATQVLTELEYLGHHRQLPRVVASAKLERSRLLLLQGHAQAARDELERANDPEVWQRAQRLRLRANDLDYLALARLRWELSYGDARAALPGLHLEIEQAGQDRRQLRLLKLRLLLAMAQHRSGDLPAALLTLDGVLRAACQEGFVRLILDEGQAAAVLLRRYETSLLVADGPRPDPIFVEFLQRLLQKLAPAGGAAVEAEDTPPADTPSGHAELPLEPLTRKEIRVLQLLAEGYSNSAMAEKLFVSDSTVRTHLRNINMKLNAHSRTQAVAIARRLSVIR